VRDGWMDRASGNEVEISRQAKERRKEESACENGRAAQRLQPRRLTGRPVIYRAEPNPSLTPLLRNYTQSVANKSKKVSAALVLIHETSALVLCLASPRFAASVPFSRKARLSSPVAKRANLCSQFDRDSGPDSARPRCTRPRVSRSREIGASLIVYALSQHFADFYRFRLLAKIIEVY